MNKTAPSYATTFQSSSFNKKPDLLSGLTSAKGAFNASPSLSPLANMGRAGAKGNYIQLADIR
jgi:hypothetical protein